MFWLVLGSSSVFHGRSHLANQRSDYDIYAQYFAFEPRAKATGRLERFEKNNIHDGCDVHCDYCHRNSLAVYYDVYDADIIIITFRLITILQVINKAVYLYLYNSMIITILLSTASYHCRSQDSG